MDAEYQFGRPKVYLSPHELARLSVLRSRLGDTHTERESAAAGLRGERTGGRTTDRRRASDAHSSSGQNAHSSSGQNAHSSSGQNGHSSSGQNAHSSSGQNAHSSSGQPPFRSDSGLIEA